jgi:hypothetical protein
MPKLGSAARGYGSMSEFAPMRHSLHFPIAPGRKIAAWVCLSAVLLLWTPLWGAAWQANGMACCGGGLCPAHGHAQANRPASPHTPIAGAPIECEHHAGSPKHSGTTSCSLSCCHENNVSLANSAIFVLPQPAILSHLAQSTAASLSVAPSEFVQSSEPLSPPPRISLFSL